jgi:hypothetical protein
MNEFKRASNEFKSQIESEINSRDGRENRDIASICAVELAGKPHFNPPPADRLRTSRRSASRSATAGS